MLRRCLAWLAASSLLVAAGAAAAALLGLGPAFQLAILLLALSALPILLLWPLPRDRIERGLRRLDEGSVFEALLEAPPGPARELLRLEARRADEGLAFRPRERPALGSRLALPFAAAALLLIAAQFHSLAGRGRPLFGGGSEGATGAAERREEGGFDALSSLAERDPEADRLGREESEEADPAASGEGGGSGPGAGLPQGRGRRLEREREAGGWEEAGAEGQGKGGTAAASAMPGPVGIGGPGEGAEPEPGEEGGSEAAGQADRGARGRGYSDSGQTAVPSPLVDYRARFARAYAERTGRRVAASGGLELGELGELERRFFRSFALEVELAPAEDGFDAMLRRRWRELRGALR